MASVNRVTIIGNLGRDPEVRFLPNGNALCTFSVATTEKWGKGEDRQERTDWHNVTVFGRTAENCGQYLSKGSSVYIEGSIRYNKVEKDGETRTYTNIVAQQVKFLSFGKGEHQGSGQSQSDSDDSMPEDDSISF